MNKYCIIPEEVDFDIDMELYEKYNHRIASMYDYLGDPYTMKEIRELEKQAKEERKWLVSDYLEGKRIYTDEDIKRIHNYLYGDKNE